MQRSLNFQDRSIVFTAIIILISILGFTAYTDVATAIIEKYRTNFHFLGFSIFFGITIAVYVLSLNIGLGKKKLTATFVIIVCAVASSNQLLLLAKTNQENKEILKVGSKLDLYSLASTNQPKNISTKIASLVSLSKVLHGSTLTMNRTSADLYTGYILSGNRAEIVQNGDLSDMTYNFSDGSPEKGYQFFPLSSDGLRGVYFYSNSQKKYSYINLNNNIVIK